ncbi:MAG: regulator [Cryobacterium sp.]|nr:regulator [Cryobacterium sp.]MBX3089314.1 regulator [Cryobacterium sp.]
MRVSTYLDSDLASRICREVERHGHQVVRKFRKRKELLSGLPASATDVLITGAGPDRLDFELLSLSDRSGISIVGLSAGPIDRRNAMNLGLNEVIDAVASWPEIEALLAPGEFGAVKDVHSDSSAAGGGPAQGRVIAVWGPAGAPGRTTVAISVAAELAAAGSTVALIDADTHSGSVAPCLGLLDEAPGLAAACRLAATDSLNAQELERISETYSSANGSFRVLTGLGRPRRWPELSAERVGKVIDACSAWVDFTIIDTGFSFEQDEEISSDLMVPRRNAATISSLESADAIIEVGAGDPVGLSRFLRAHVDLIEAFNAGSIVTVINKVRASAIGANPGGQVERTLQRFGGISRPHLIPFDHSALDAALISGRTLLDAAPRSQVRGSMSRLAAELGQSMLSRRAG